MPYGWDARVNCAAVAAHLEGLDPYFVKNLKGTNFFYPYLPVTLDAFRPLCAGGVLLAHQTVIFIGLAVLSALLLPALGKSRGDATDVALKLLCAFGAFAGFEWVVTAGNFAILSGLLTALALALLLGNDRQTLVPRVAGAVVLGLVTSLKLVFFPVLAALYFLPLPRGQKLIVLAAGVAGFVAPLLISMVFYSRHLSELAECRHWSHPRTTFARYRREESVAVSIRDQRCGSARILRSQAQLPLPPMGCSQSHSSSRRLRCRCCAQSARSPDR